MSLIRRWMSLVLLAGLSHAAVVMAAEPRTGEIEVRGVRLHYVTAGEGPPVVLIHGLHASGDLNWRKPGLFDALARNYRVIALDLPGHGQSDKPEQAEAYGAQMVEDVLRLMDHLKVPKAHLVGYSLGGLVAAKLAVGHPERVQSLTLCGAGWLRADAALLQFWERMPLRETVRTPQAVVKSFDQLALTAEEVKQIKLPTTVIIGDRDPLRKMYVEPLPGIRPDWPIVEIADAGHLNCVLKPQFREELLKALKSYPALVAP